MAARIVRPGEQDVVDEDDVLFGDGEGDLGLEGGSARAAAREVVPVAGDVDDPDRDVRRPPSSRMIRAMRLPT